MRNVIALALLYAGAAFGQVELYTASAELNLVAQSGALAIQLPATGNNEADIVEVTAQCLDAPCDLRPEVNGAAAGAGTSATAVTLVAVDPETSLTATIGTRLQAWSGTGTQIPVGTALAPANGWRIGFAGGMMSFKGGRKLRFEGVSAGNRNYILRVVGTHTGVVRLFISVQSRRL